MVSFSDKITNSKEFRDFDYRVTRLTQRQNGFEDMLLLFKKTVNRKKFKIVSEDFVIDSFYYLCQGFKEISVKYQVIATSDNSVICEGIFNPDGDDYFIENGKRYVHKYGEIRAGFFPA